MAREEGWFLLSCMSDAVLIVRQWEDSRNGATAFALIREVAVNMQACLLRVYQCFHCMSSSSRNGIDFGLN
jgi:hypothetical protein